MKEMIRDILGIDRLEKLMEYANKLHREPEDLLKEVIDAHLFGIEDEGLTI